RLEAHAPVADYDRGRAEAEHEWPWERWQGCVEAREATLTRSSDSLHRWSLEQLATARCGERVFAGFVARVAFDTPDQLALTLKLWPGVPKAIALRPLSAAGTDDAL